MVPTGILWEQMGQRTGLGMWSMLQRLVGRLDGDIKRDGLVRGIGNGVAGASWEGDSQERPHPTGSLRMPSSAWHRHRSNGSPHPFAYQRIDPMPIRFIQLTLDDIKKDIDSPNY